VGEPRTFPPLQQQVYEELFAAGQPRPSFAPDLSRRLRARLLDELEPVAERLELGGQFLSVTKRQLAKVHACELHHVTEEFPGWSAPLARGTVADKAIGLGVHAPVPLAPADMVDFAISRLKEDADEWSPGEWLRNADPVEVAEVRAGAVDLVTKFVECFPPLSPDWHPGLEWQIQHTLFQNVIVLRAKVDLKLGHPRPQHQAGVLFVDFKSGSVYPAHVDDLRWYALVETLRAGVPPFRVASYYLDEGRWRHEEVDEALLEVAARRAVDGIKKLAELRLHEREPTVTPGPSCRYCSLRDTCEGAVRWAETAANVTS
jgi:CRISPR/Cas system-associated exonuclease Cas4 (RecB family)